MNTIFKRSIISLTVCVCVCICVRTCASMLQTLSFFFPFCRPKSIHMPAVVVTDNLFSFLVHISTCFPLPRVLCIMTCILASHRSLLLCLCRTNGCLIKIGSHKHITVCWTGRELDRRGEDRPGCWTPCWKSLGSVCSLSPACSLTVKSAAFQSLAAQIDCATIHVTFNVH